MRNRDDYLCHISFSVCICLCILTMLDGACTPHPDRAHISCHMVLSAYTKEQQSLQKWRKIAQKNPETGHTQRSKKPAKVKKKAQKENPETGGIKENFFTWWAYNWKAAESFSCSPILMHCDARQWRAGVPHCCSCDHDKKKTKSRDRSSLLWLCSFFFHLICHAMCCVVQGGWRNAAFISFDHCYTIAGASGGRQRDQHTALLKKEWLLCNAAILSLDHSLAVMQ